MHPLLDWRRSCSVLFALGLLGSGCAEGTGGVQMQNEGSAHGDDDGGASDDGEDDDEIVSDDEDDEDDEPAGDDDGEPTDDDDDADPELDAGGDDTSSDDVSPDDDWGPTDSVDDGSSDGSDDGSGGDASVPDPDGCLTLAPNAASPNFNTVDAVCFSISAQPSTAWEVYRLGNRTITIDGTSVTAGQLPWPGSPPFVVEFSAGSDSTTAWAYW